MIMNVKHSKLDLRIGDCFPLKRFCDLAADDIFSRYAMVEQNAYICSTFRVRDYDNQL